MGQSFQWDCAIATCYARREIFSITMDYSDCYGEEKSLLGM